MMNSGIHYVRGEMAFHTALDYIEGECTEEVSARVICNIEAALEKAKPGSFHAFEDFSRLLTPGENRRMVGYMEAKAREKCLTLVIQHTVRESKAVTLLSRPNFADRAEYALGSLQEKVEAVIAAIAEAEASIQGNEQRVAFDFVISYSGVEVAATMVEMNADESAFLLNALRLGPKCREDIKRIVKALKNAPKLYSGLKKAVPSLGDLCSVQN